MPMPAKETDLVPNECVSRIGLFPKGANIETVVSRSYYNLDGEFEEADF